METVVRKRLAWLYHVRLWHLNIAHLVLMGPECANKISSTQFNPPAAACLEIRQDECMFSCSFIVFITTVTAEMMIHQTTFIVQFQGADTKFPDIS